LIQGIKDIYVVMKLPRASLQCNLYIPFNSLKSDFAFYAKHGKERENETHLLFRL